MQPRVSVIIPIYNVEKYLKQCLDSVLLQSYNNLEIILVDDGSPDACPSICDEYQKIDSRITVIHKSNAGLGLARNSGLEIAKGEYIVFIDSDDWIERDYVDKLVETAKKNNSDMVLSGFNRRGSNVKASKSFSYVLEESNYDKEQIIEKVLLPILGAKPEAKDDIEYSMCVWTNLYNRRIIENNKIRFVNEREFLSEDLFFNINYILNCQKISIIPDILYNYRMNEKSLTNIFRQDRYELLCNLHTRECELLKQYGVFEKAFYRVYRTFIMKARNTIRILVSASNLSYRQKISALKKILASELLQNILSEYPLRLYRFSLRVPARLMKGKHVHLLYIEEKIRNYLR